jgi:hypothetical protein
MPTTDQPRLLHKHSQHGYTRSAALAMRHEPEAVTIDEQWLITQATADLQLKTWLTSRQRIVEEIEHLRAHLHSPHVDRATRAMLREVASLDRKLA